MPSPLVPVDCSVTGCGRPAKVRGYCSTHYSRVRRTGTPGEAAVRPRNLSEVQYGPVCRVEDCADPTKSHGYCQVHYRRWTRHGSPDVLLRPHSHGPRISLRQVTERVLEALPSSDCVEWPGKRDRRGYGRAKQPPGAHTLIYQLVVGPVPDGLELDHLCRNPPCVNPAHLEPVTHAENLARVPRPTHCPQGHPYDEENTYRRPDRNGRECRTCISVRRRKPRTEDIA